MGKKKLKSMNSREFYMQEFLKLSTVIAFDFGRFLENVKYYLHSAGNMNKGD